MNCHEEWRDIPGMVGFYQASSLGRIRRVARTVRSSYGSTQNIKQRMVKTSPRGIGGYIAFTPSINGVAKTVNVHRCIALAFIKRSPGRPLVNHKNSNRSDNRVENLEWCSSKENCAHASINGRLPTGESHHSKRIPWATPRGSRVHNALLTEEDVADMRHRFRNGESVADISRGYRVSFNTAWYAIHRKTWKHVA